MADDIKAIFQEYTRLRLHGLEASEAVRALYEHLNGLDASTRAELARNMRAWENQRTEKISLLEREQLKKASEAMHATESISCSNCGKVNSSVEITCYSCGVPLTTIKKATDILPNNQNTMNNDAQLKEDDFVHLIPKDDVQELIVLRPQRNTGRMLIGRGDEPDSMIDIDLNPYGAGEKGVSRLHASFTYDNISETLMLFDMGSTNGTFINGQRLHSNERRTMRHHDELQFGRLAFRIIYKRS